MERQSLPTAGFIRLRIPAIVTLVLLTLSFIWIFVDLLVYLQLRSIPVDPDRPGNLAAAGFIVRILLYPSFGLLLLRSFSRGLKATPLVVLSIITGTVSAIALAFDFAALEDIGSDYLIHGYRCTLEWLWLFGSLFIRLAFYVVLALLLKSVLKSRRSFSPAMRPVIDETLYEITQWVGIVCGATGVAFTIYAYAVLGDFTLKSWLLWLLLFYCVVIIMPWMALLIYWIFRLAGRTELTLYDEKQRHDLAFSGMTAWLTGIPMMAVVLVISLCNASSPVVFLWFPFWLFATVMVFSTTLLLRYRRR